MSRSFLVLFI
ncbi:hypothetical protein RDI58_020551 [Solanum bulbocastanum]|uniref:Uncharacterized protein n=1 Tax=Solanum bulbocastanum TaxID=147425 RepID=A0AAN8Y7R6_SOLBU